MIKFQAIDGHKAEEILKVAKITQVVIEASHIKQIEFDSPYGFGRLVATDYGGGVKVLLEERPRYWVLQLDPGRDVPKDLEIMAEYVVEQKLKFPSKASALTHIEKLSVKECLEVVEVDPNNLEIPKQKTVTNDELPF